MSSRVRARTTRRAALALGLALLALGLPAPAVLATASRGAHAHTRVLSAPGERPPMRPRMRPVGCRIRGATGAFAQGPPAAVRQREVALSFDDGPGALTRAFVRMLHAHHAVATFFMIGQQVSPSYRPVLREELRDGDALGDHTWSHPDLLYSREAASQLRGAREVIRRETGYAPCVFRPPYEAYDGAIVRTARSLGLATVTWDVDPADWSLPGVSTIVARVLAQVRPGSIVLSHDGGGPRGQTLAAYPEIIEALRRRGYRFVTVPQLLGFRTLYRPCGRRCQTAAPPAHRPLPGAPRRRRCAGPPRACPLRSALPRAGSG
jgi:peptidoglycan-N-acetylglucosamine deacetylase